MATVQDLAKDSLYSILVEGESSPLEPEDYDRYWKHLNRYMKSLEGRNINLGYTTVSSSSDEVTVPEEVEDGIAANMAIQIAPSYGAPVHQGLIERARLGMRTMRRIGRRDMSTAYPSGLPRGSGMRYISERTQDFYGRVSKAHIYLYNNADETAIATVSTPVKVRGFWEQASAVGYNTDITGRVTWIGDESIRPKIQVTMEVTGDGVGRFWLYKNQVALTDTSTSATLTSTPQTITITHSQTLQPGEFIEIWCQNETDTDNILVSQAKMEFL